MNLGGNHPVTFGEGKYIYRERKKVKCIKKEKDGYNIEK